MYEKGIVTAIRGSDVQVLPLPKDACATCTASCAKRGKAITAANPRGLPLAVGSVVTVTAKKSMQYLQGAVALLVPTLCAVAGYLLAPLLWALAGRTAGDGARALCVLLFLFLSGAAVFAVTRFSPIPGKPEIAEAF